MRTHTVQQSVRYAETDRMQVAHHSTYLLWFEIGRTALLAEAGFPYDALERGGTLFPVVEYWCRMSGSVDYGDTVDIETGVANVRSRWVEFCYEVKNRGRTIARGGTKHVPVDRDKKAKRLPDGLFRALLQWSRISNGPRNR
jgi:acyl-CoA thioester hydrolase